MAYRCLRPLTLTFLNPVSRQLLLVLADGWDESAGRLWRFARNGGAVGWQAVAGPVAVSLGRAGLAWGRGLQPPGGVGPAKREGDGRSPAGLFPVTGLFGDGGPASDPARAARLPYQGATPDLKCVDDPASRHYNRIVDQTRVERDWHSCEDMLRPDRRYEIGAVVGCNCDPAAPGAGSCIFLHVWESPGVPTAGCTALAREDMLALAGWLDGALAPVLVQLPRAVYRQVREGWGLPEV